MQVVALTAASPRSGKTTFAKALVDQMETRGLRAARIAFADALKEQCAVRLSSQPDVRNILRDIDQTDTKDFPLKSLRIDNVADFEYRQFLKDAFEDHETPRSWRWHCIEFGTAFMREHKDDQLVWIRLLNNKILQMRWLGYDVVVVDDLRTAAEADSLRMLRDVAFFDIGRTDIREAPAPTEPTYTKLKHTLEGTYMELQFDSLNALNFAATSWAIRYAEGIE